MILSHFFAMLPIFLILGFAIWVKRVIVDIIGIAYIAIVGYMAIIDINDWELLFFPILVGFGIVFLVMLIVHAVKGELI